MKSLIIAIDFDGVIAEGYPVPQYAIKDAVWGINALYRDGHHLILYTCRNEALQLAKDWLRQRDLLKCFANINANAEHAIEAYSDSRKIGADIYIDDKNIGGLPSWKKIVKIIRRACKNGRGSMYNEPA